MGISILPSARTPWDLIGGMIGENLSKNLPGAVQQGYQRQLGMNALSTAEGNIKNLMADKSKPPDPFQIAMEFAKVAAQNPNLERAIGPLYQTALQQSQRQTGAGEFPPGHPKKTTGEGAEQKEVPVSVSDLVPPKQSQVSDPRSIGDFTLPYGPDEISGIRQKARQLGYTADMEERFVNDALEYNKIAQNRRDIDIQNYQQQQQQRADTLQNQRDFEKYMVEHSPEFANNPDEKELALRASQKYQKEHSFAERNAKVKEELRPYQAAKTALKKTLNRPLFGQTKEQRELARPRAQMMVEMGQKPQLQLMIANGGNGEIEEADLLNPLPSKFENNLDKFGKIVSPLDFVKSIDPDSSEYNEQLDRGRQKRENQKKYMTNFLADNIESGTYKDPGTNLLLTRAHLMNKGMQWDEAGQLIDQALNQGKIKLDPQQKIDYQKLAYPPLTADNYLDTVMNNIMFPITGKQ